MSPLPPASSRRYIYVWSVSEQDPVQLTVGPLLGFCWQMFCWPKLRQNGLLLLWANMEQQLANMGPINLGMIYIKTGNNSVLYGSLNYLFGIFCLSEKKIFFVK